MFRPPLLLRPLRPSTLSRLPLRPLQHRTTSTTATPPPKTSDFIWCTRFLFTFSAHVLLTTSLGIYLASQTHPMLSSGPLEKHTILSRPALPAPLATDRILAALGRHPLYTSLTSPTSKWTFLDAWRTLTPEELKRKLIPGTYAGERRIELNRVFTSEDGNEMVSFLSLGTAMCGFPGIVHGGVSASVLDEAFGRLAIKVVGGDAVTARLGLKYKRPVVAGEGWEGEGCCV